MPWAAVLPLLLASFRGHRGRFLAAGFAIALAASLLLAAFVSLQWLRDQGPRSADTLLGESELHLAATDSIHPFIPEKTIADMRGDPRVANLVTAMTVRAVDMVG